jgi:hypothetical protein
VLALTVRAPAESPRDELLRMVPDDVGFCLVVEDVRGHAARLAESPFVRQFHEAPMGALLNADRDWQMLNAGREKIEAVLGLDWTRLRDDVLGDAVVFAYRPSLPAGPPGDQTLILLRARDQESLAKLVERINSFQKVSGEIEAVEPRDRGGQRYFQRVGAKAAPFYALLGPVLAVSSDEALLREALDRRSRGTASEPALARRFRQMLGTERRLASLWVNPRAFDAAVAAKAEQGHEQHKAIAKSFLSYWNALDAVALGVGVQDEFTCTLAVRARMERLPPAARRFFAEAAKPSDLWRRFPDNALFAFAGRFDASAFEEMLGELLAPGTRRTLREGLDRYVGAALDKDVIADVLPCLGPDFGGCITVGEDGKSWPPVFLFALGIRPGDKLPHVDKSLFSALNALAQAAVIDHNAKHAERMVLKTVVQDKVEVKYLAGGTHFPPGLQPAFALKDGYLVLASSPEAVRRFTLRSARPAEGEVPLLRVSFTGLRRYLEAHRSAISAALSGQNKSTPADVEKQLDAMLLGLRAFDRLEVSQRTVEGQVALTLHVRPTLSLQK